MIEHLTALGWVWWIRTVVGSFGAAACTVGLGVWWWETHLMAREPSCRVCGCTEWAGCLGGCSWVPDPFDLGPLCSRCEPLEQVLFDDAEAWAAGSVDDDLPRRVVVSEMGGQFPAGEWTQHRDGVWSLRLVPPSRGEGS